MSSTPYVHVAADLATATRGGSVDLAADEVHHLVRVLRLRPGAEVVVADGRGREADAVLGETHVVVTADPVTRPPSRPRLVLAQALPKGRKLDDVVRVATELGVDRIVPVTAARSVVSLRGERADRAVERWRAVGRAAAEQARRPVLPVIDPPAELAALPGLVGVDGTAGTAVLLVATPGAPALPDQVRSAWHGCDVVAVAVGPEGGFTDQEVTTLVAAGGVPVGLGPTVLRTEHAGAAAVAVLAALLGRWRG
jgi:16S rRNA (uracil1498-N3)-methyltransferase